MRNDDIGAESDKFLGVLLGTIASPVGIAKLDLDVFTIRVAEGVQTAPECIGERMRRRRGHQHSNKGEFSWSLCARPKGPRRSHSAEQRNELPSPHGHSLHARITTTSHTLPRRRKRRVVHHSILAHPTCATGHMQLSRPPPRSLAGTSAYPPKPDAVTGAARTLVCANALNRCRDSRCAGWPIEGCVAT